MNIRDYTNFSTPLSHPGAHLREDFLPDFGMTASDLAQAIGIPNVSEVEDILQERAPINGEMALRLGRLFQTTPEFWMKLQVQHDLSREAIRLRVELEQIVPAQAP